MNIIFEKGVFYLCGSAGSDLTILYPHGTYEVLTEQQVIDLDEV